MANLTELQEYYEGIYQLEVNDPVLGGPEGIANRQAKELASRTKFLNETMGSAVFKCISDIGVLQTEVQRQNDFRHQEGEVLLLNRGRKSGCDVSISGGDITVTPGEYFMLGRVFYYPGETKSLSTSDGYVVLDPDNGVQDVEEIPEDCVVLGTLSDWAFSSTVRTEPNFPQVLTDPFFYQHTFDKILRNTEYTVSVCVSSYEGGEEPRIVCPADNKTVNTFRMYLDSSSDKVKVNFITHLMRQ